MQRIKESKNSCYVKVEKIYLDDGVLRIQVRSADKEIIVATKESLMAPELPDIGWTPTTMPLKKETVSDLSKENIEKLANGTTENISPELKIDSNESTERKNSLKRITHSIKRRLDFSSLFFVHRLESDHIGVKLPTSLNELTEQQNTQEPEESQEPPELERLTSRQASEKEIGII